MLGLLLISSRATIFVAYSNYDNYFLAVTWSPDFPLLLAAKKCAVHEVGRWFLEIIIPVMASSLGICCWKH
jgi:hypothetical protein